MRMGWTMHWSTNTCKGNSDEQEVESESCFMSEGPANISSLVDVNGGWAGKEDGVVVTQLYNNERLMMNLHSMEKSSWKRLYGLASGCTISMEDGGRSLVVQAVKYSRDLRLSVWLYDTLAS